VALARPQRLSSDPAEVEGIDIVIALDVSESMRETDMAGSRIDAAKSVIEQFIQRNPTDRIGLVIFGKEAFTQCPLTLDTRAVVGLLKDVRIGLVDGRGTAIGNALGTAINRLRKSTAKSKVIVLVTDGDDNASKLDPRKAAKFAQTFGVKVFTILIGRDVGEAPPPGQDRFGNWVRPQPKYPVNPKLLEEIAETTGGMPFLATDKEALEKRFQAILEDLDRSKLKAQTPHYAELYPALVAPALMLVLLEILLSLTRFRRFP
jgi:Ca-activated chloride channel family protein